ncbi:MAG: phytanoyl-CoA dioxygenase family protein [bacterium]|nr:phytanoyl-CoA dioxygenase family protein [bacterium]
MTTDNKIPSASYGILQQNLPDSTLDEAAEQVRNLGYAIIDSGYTAPELHSFSEEFNCTRDHYVQTYGESELRGLNEFHTIRAPLTHGGDAFLKLALNEHLLSLLKKLIPGKFILNQQNGVINPPQETYNQGAWHRDLPYQHFVSTKPLAINALFCVDDFTFENGATFVLPASHKAEAFPSENYVRKNAIQVEAKAGSFIVLDCMVFHAGGFNKTNLERRAVNHLYNIPYFKQQINIPMNMTSSDLSPEVRDILGFTYAEPTSISDYLSKRTDKKY